jgi:hypothetical protein
MPPATLPPEQYPQLTSGDLWGSQGLFDTPDCEGCSSAPRRTRAVRRGLRGITLSPPLSPPVTERLVLLAGVVVV